MSSTPSATSDVTRARLPTWFADFLGVELPAEGQEANIRGQRFVMERGILRSVALVSANQAQTEKTFGFKWQKRDTFDSPNSLARMREWLVARYGDISTAKWLPEHGPKPLVLDAGCGAGMSALELFGPLLAHIRYLGIDISVAVDVARQRYAERGFNSAAFMQANLTQLPLTESSVDIVFSEGVLHHTDSTEQALKCLARLLKCGGRFLFYVYRKKGPVREFTDDYIRAKLQNMTPAQAWTAMKPLTQLGIAIGKLDTEIDIAEPIDLLGIPAGRINLQRLFYWHVAKTFYDPMLTFDEMNHINFDWYAPANAHRQTPEQVRRWCQEAGLTVEREMIEDAGITVIARRAP